MTYDLLSTVLGLGVGFATAYAVHLVWRLQHTHAIRQDAVKRSHAVAFGKAYEQLAPFTSSFDFDPRDVRFLGSPIDLVVFDGLSAGNLERVVFVEVKTGQSRLSAREQELRTVIERRDVSWMEIRPQ